MREQNIVPSVEVRELLSVERKAVPGRCPKCGGEELSQYPVLAEHGWFVVVKCPSCLTSVSRERWRRLGWLSLHEDRV